LPVLAVLNLVLPSELTFIFNELTPDEDILLEKITPLVKLPFFNQQEKVAVVSLPVEDMLLLK
jgi:hypothetical protein